MNRLDACFQSRKRPGQSAFLAFLTAGDPDLETTAKVALAIAQAAERRGVPLILEIGFPYSDPIADGPTIQTSYTRALANGVRVDAILRTIGELRPRLSAPLVGMASYSLVLRRGIEKFLADARQSGLDGLILPDLPVEEAQGLGSLAEKEGLALIQLVAPTTPPDRVETILASSSGFVYYISVAGITGERRELPPDLRERIEDLKRRTRLPVCVGFGISTPEQVAALRGSVDGVIVGSAIVRRLENLSKSKEHGIRELAAFVESLLAPLAESSTPIPASPVRPRAEDSEIRAQ